MGSSCSSAARQQRQAAANTKRYQPKRDQSSFSLSDSEDEDEEEAELRRKKESTQQLLEQLFDRRDDYVEKMVKKKRKKRSSRSGSTSPSHSRRLAASLPQHDFTVAAAASTAQERETSTTREDSVASSSHSHSLASPLVESLAVQRVFMEDCRFPNTSSSSRSVSSPPPNSHYQQLHSMRSQRDVSVSFSSASAPLSPHSPPSPKRLQYQLEENYHSKDDSSLLLDDDVRESSYGVTLSTNGANPAATHSSSVSDTMMMYNPDADGAVGTATSSSALGRGGPFLFGNSMDSSGDAIDSPLVAEKSSEEDDNEDCVDGQYGHCGPPRFSVTQLMATTSQEECVDDVTQNDAKNTVAAHLSDDDDDAVIFIHSELPPTE